MECQKNWFSTGLNRFKLVLNWFSSDIVVAEYGTYGRRGAAGWRRSRRLFDDPGIKTHQQNETQETRDKPR